MLEPLGQVVAVLVLCGSFVAGGLVYWPRGNPVDQLASRRLRGMAYAVSGIGFAPVILALALGLPILATALIMILWLGGVCGLFIAFAVADTRERREADRRNAALDWPCGRPPRHPGWGLTALLAWGCPEPVVSTDRPGSWISGTSTMVGVAARTVSSTVTMTWLVVLVLGIGCTLMMAWRRLRWEYSGRHRDEDEKM